MLLLREVFKILFFVLVCDVLLQFYNASPDCLGHLDNCAEQKLALVSLQCTLKYIPNFSFQILLLDLSDGSEACLYPV